MEVQTETPEHILFRAQTAALVKVLGRKKGEALLRAMCADLAMRIELSEVIPIRGASAQPSRVAATAEAVRSFHADLPQLLAAARL